MFEQCKSVLCEVTSVIVMEAHLSLTCDGLLNLYRVYNSSRTHAQSHTLIHICKIDIRLALTFYH